MSVSKLLLCLTLLCALPASLPAHAQKSLPGAGNGTGNVAVEEPPTITVSHSPATLVAGQPYSITWSALRSTSIRYVCTSTGSGYTAQGTVFTANGSLTGTANAAWVGNPSNCVWTASNVYGTETAQDNLSTVAPVLVNGASVYGTKGAIRTDVILGPDPAKPVAIYDLKTGISRLTEKRAEAIRRYFPGFKGPIIAIYPQFLGEKE